MKAFMLYGLIILAMQQQARCQWNLITATDSMITYRDIFFFNDTLGFVSGYDSRKSSGIVLKTTNGGASWDTTMLGLPYYPYSIHFANDSIGYLAGHNSFIGKTYNGGQTWQTLTTNIPHSKHFRHVHFLNDTVGFAMTDNGPYFTKTYDGGYTWVYDSIAGLLGAKDFQVIDSTIFTISGAVLRFSHDYGDTWQSSIISTGNGYTFNDVYFVNKDTGFVVGNSQSPFPPFEKFGAMACTYNGGVTWEPVTIFSDFFFLHEIIFLNINTGFLIGHKVGGGGAFLKTTDGGQTWYYQESFGIYNSPGGASKFAIIDENIGYASGIFGTVFKTTNGGGPLGALINLGLDDVTSPKLQVYPNPASSQFEVVVEGMQGNAQLSLFDQTGRLVHSQTVNARSTVNIATLAMGVYTGRIVQGDEVVVFRVVKQ